MRKPYHKDDYIAKFKNTSNYTYLTSCILSAARGDDCYGPLEPQYTVRSPHKPRSIRKSIFKRMCDNILEELYAASNKSNILILDHATEWYKEQMLARALKQAMKSMTLRELIEYKCRTNADFQHDTPQAESLYSKILIKSDPGRSLQGEEPTQRISPEIKQQMSLDDFRNAMNSMTLKDLLTYKCGSIPDISYETPPADCCNIGTTKSLSTEPRVSHPISLEFKQQLSRAALRKAMKSMTLKELIAYKCRGYGHYGHSECDSPSADCLKSEKSKRLSQPSYSVEVALPVKSISETFKQHMQKSALIKAIQSMTLKELIKYKYFGSGKFECELPPADCLDSQTRTLDSKRIIRSSDSSYLYQAAEPINRTSSDFKQPMQQSALRKAMKSMTLKELIEYKCRNYENSISKKPLIECINSKMPIRSSHSCYSDRAESINRMSAELKQKMRNSVLRKTIKSTTLNELIESKCRDYGNIKYELPSVKNVDSYTPTKLESSDSFRIPTTIRRISPEFLELLRDHDVRLKKMFECSSVIHQHKLHM